MHFSKPQNFPHQSGGFEQMKGQMEGLFPTLAARPRIRLKLQHARNLHGRRREDEMHTHSNSPLKGGVDLSFTLFYSGEAWSKP